MADIFISYSQTDKAKVRLIAETLEAAGYDVFWDPEIPPGETWDNVIARELKSAQCVLVAWSEQSSESDWVKEEADFGKRRKALVPVQIDDAGPPLGFSRIQTADLRHWNGDPSHPEWAKVIARIQHHGAAEVGHEPDPRQSAKTESLRSALYDPPRQSGEPPRPREQPSLQSQSFTSARAQTGGSNLQTLLLKPTGRIGKRSFWIGVGILFAINLAAALMGAGGIGAILALALIYPSVCVYGKRLHDLGLSAWIYAALLGATMFVALVFGTMALESGAFETEALAAANAGAFLTTLAYTLWLGVAKGRDAPNKHGPPPGGATQADVFS